MKKKSESNHHDESVQELVERVVLSMWEPFTCIMADTIMNRNRKVEVLAMTGRYPFWVSDACQLSCTQQQKLSSINKQSPSTDYISLHCCGQWPAGRGAGIDPQIVEEN
jgi:hypothetical protein